MVDVLEVSAISTGMTLIPRERPQDNAAAFIAGLEQLVKLITDIPKAMLQTPQGAGTAAMLIGATMKQLGIGVLKKEYFIKDRFNNEGEKWLFSTNPKNPGLVVKFGSQDAACRLGMGEGVRNATCELKVVADPLVIDIFPFEIIGVIKEDFGKMSIADMLMTGGFMALTGDFWKGIGEIVPG